MARFFGAVGFAHNVEIRRGVYDDLITEKTFKGELIRPSLRASMGEQINANLVVGNSISIVMDAYLLENFFAIRYVTWMGVRWSVKKVDVAHPRLTLALGEVYNGPTP